jgi:hypothetical protein
MAGERKPKQAPSIKEGRVKAVQVRKVVGSFYICEEKHCDSRQPNSK